MFKRIKNTWKSMTTTEKVKFVLGLVADFGCGAVSTGIGLEMTKDEGPVTRVCGVVGMMGLGMAAGELSSQKLGELVDEVDDLCKVVKAKKEAKANE